MSPGTVAVIPLGVEPAAIARRLAAAGATVVLLAGASEEARATAGRLAAEIEASGRGRAAVFTIATATDAGQINDAAAADALIEYLNELFRA